MPELMSNSEPAPATTGRTIDKDSPLAAAIVRDQPAFEAFGREVENFRDVELAREFLDRHRDGQVGLGF